jgi:hypothetical protein
MVPRTLREWTLDAVSKLLYAGAYESDLFDFKERLPDSKNEDDKKRLRRTCCSFANTDGGFLVFGIVDDKSLQPIQRIVGIDRSTDFPEHFGNYPRTCSPSIDWDFLNPPIALTSGRVLHVVHLPRSWRAPHAVGSPDAGWTFVKRTNKGAEGMTMEEIRASFLGYYEKRLKLQLLKAELLAIRDSAAHAFVSDPENASTSYVPVTFDFGVVTSIVSDTYSITADYPELHRALGTIRQEGMMANNMSRIFFSTVGLPLSNKNSVVLEHNRRMEQTCRRLGAACEAATSTLDEVLGTW